MGDKLKVQSEKYLTEIRLFRYHEIGNDNYLGKYTLNMEVSEKLLSTISIFEIIFRNKIHLLLSNGLAKDYLTNPDASIFNKYELNKIRSAYRKAENAGVQVKDSKTMTYLPLGFWCRLIKKNQLWCTHLYKLFSQETRRTNKLRNIIEMIDAIHTIRNMISHHERIICKPGINISGTLTSLANLTLWLIEPQDIDFHDYIEAYFRKKSDEINELLGKQ